jgi:hypothetical protein
MRTAQPFSFKIPALSYYEFQVAIKYHLFR